MFRLVHQHAFDDLDLEAARVELRGSQGPDHGRHEGRVLHLGRRQVDGHGHVLAPVGGLFDGLADHPFAQRHDDSGLFGAGNEHAGRHQAVARTVPAQQRLIARNLARAGVHQRLEVDIHGLVGERVAEIRLQIGAHAGRFIHARLEETGAAAALGLGAIEGQLGILHQNGGVGAVFGGERHADAAAGQDFAAIEDDRSQEGVDEMIGHLAGFFGRQVPLQDGEFVAAKAGEEGVGADTIAQALGHDLEEGVARRVALGVVQRLEVVEVDHEQGERLAARFGGFLRDFKLADQHGAVWKVGQAVVFGRVGDQCLGIARAGDVGAHAAPAAIGGGLAADRPPAFARADGHAQNFVAERLALFQDHIEHLGGFSGEQRQQAAALEDFGREPGRIDKARRGWAQTVVLVHAPEPVGRMRLEIVEQEAHRLLGFFQRCRIDHPADIVRMRGRGEALKRRDAPDEQQGGAGGPLMVAEQQAEARAKAHEERIAEGRSREAGVQQRADAEDGSRENAEQHMVLRPAGRDEGRDDAAPQQAAEQRIVDDTPVFDGAFAGNGRAAAFADTDEDEHRAGIAPHEHERHGGLGPEGKGQDDCGKERMNGCKRGQRMKAAAALCGDRILMGRRNIHLPKEKGLEIRTKHKGRSHQTAPRQCRALLGKLAEQGRFPVKSIGEISSIGSGKQPFASP